MAAGELDRRIIIEDSTTAANSYNELIKTWATHTTVWAKYSPVSDIEALQAGKEAAGLTARFLVRYSSDTSPIDATYRIQWPTGTYWNITGVKESRHGRGRFIEITATKAST